MATATRRSPSRPSLRRPRAQEAREQGQPAVDEDRLAGDVGGHVAGQEARDAGHLVGVAGALHRDVLLDLRPLDRVVDPRTVDRRHRRAGADAVDADPAAGVLERERAGEVLHPALARRVAQVAGLRDELVDARDVDDRAALVLVEEVADRLAGAHERAPTVDPPHAGGIRAWSTP